MAEEEDKQLMVCPGMDRGCEGKGCHGSHFVPHPERADCSLKCTGLVGGCVPSDPTNPNYLFKVRR